MVKVHLKGLMGNHMFQYAIAHLLARKYHTYFLLDTNDVRFGLYYFQLEFPYSLFSNKWVFKVYNKAQKWIQPKNYVDLTDCSTDYTSFPFTDNTYYRGYFQNAGLMEGHEEECRRIFSIKKHYKKGFEKYEQDFKHHKTLVIQMRIGDYKSHIVPEINGSLIIESDWYTKVLRGIDLSQYKVYVVSDEIEKAKSWLDPFVSNSEYSRDEAIVQFQMVMHADVAVVSNSTFGWWAGFLNSKPHKRIIAPKYFLGHNVGKEFPVGIEGKHFEWV